MAIQMAAQLSKSNNSVAISNYFWHISLVTMCTAVLFIICLQGKNWCMPNWQTDKLGDDHPDFFSTHMQITYHVSITISMYKVLTKQMSSADVAEVNNKCNTLPQPQPLAEWQANKHPDRDSNGKKNNVYTIKEAVNSERVSKILALNHVLNTV